MQRVVIRERYQLESVANKPHKKKTTLTEWLDYHNHHADGRQLTYLDFPSKYVWDKSHKYWQRRRQLNRYSLCRMSYVHPAAGDLFYQRILLSHQKGCTSFRDIRTINHIVYPTCRAACEAMGLLGDDKEWETTLIEASTTATPSELRTLLAHIFTHCIPNLHIDPSELENYTKYEFEACLNHCSRSLADFGIPLPPEDLIDKSIDKLNDCQRNIFNLIIHAVATRTQELIFVYGHDGTGKTFLWKTIIYALRAEGKIVLAVASSGIASLLLPSGDGVLGVPDESDPENTSWLEIPAKFQIPNDENGLTKLIEFIYDKDIILHPNAKDLQDKAIICPKNDIADVINAKVMDMLPGCATTYISNDEAIPHGQNGGEVELLYPIEYLNTLNFAGIPPHELKLKIGSPIMLLRNINIIGGLCNGTRMIVTTIELANVDDSGQQNKGKIILTEPKITYISELSSTAYDKTIEAIGTPIQANMGLLDAEYFDQLLQLQKAYQFTGYSCEPTDKWERTLPTETSLIFGRFLQVQEIPGVEFPEHYFNFAAYNELQDRLTAKNPILTACGQKLKEEYSLPKCKHHGPQTAQVYSYCFKAMVNNGSATTPITCFSDQAHTLTRNVNEVVAELQDKNPFALPLCLQQLQRTTHIFQFHFDTMTSSRRPDFVLDKVFPTPTLALPQPEPIEAPEPDTASIHQEIPQQSPTLEEIKESDDSEETIFAHSSEPQITTPLTSKLSVVETNGERRQSEEITKVLNQKTTLRRPTRNNQYSSSAKEAENRAKKPSPPQDLDFESDFIRSHGDTNHILEELLRTLKTNSPVGEPERSNDFTEPLDTFLMGDEITSTISERENDEFIKSGVDNLVPILRESELTLVSTDLECSMPIDPPLHCTDVLEDTTVDIDLPFGEHLDTFSKRDREIDFNPRDIETNDLISEFEDISNLDPFELTLVIDESPLLVTPLPDPKQIYLREVERFDHFFSLTQSGGKTRVIETSSFSFHHMPSPRPAAYSPTEVMYCYYHPHLTPGFSLIVKTFMLVFNPPITRSPVDLFVSKCGEIPSDESKVHIEVLPVLWENRLPIPNSSLSLSRLELKGLIRILKNSLEDGQGLDDLLCIPK
uniref:ATP-dependent DNA helicase n=1 Tax=Tanacetum cinerariifolium TaxID=118510 RepID=A0A6L2MSX8_TANCI|nr:DNA helicase [Tanacetum cinerariifolium]